MSTTGTGHTSRSYRVRFTTDTGDGGTIRFSEIARSMVSEFVIKGYHVKYGRSLYGRPNPFGGGAGLVDKVELITEVTTHTVELIEP